MCLDWDVVSKQLTEGFGDAEETADTFHVDGDAVLEDFSLDSLDPTQRAFADRVLKWAASVARTYEAVRADGKHRRIPLLKAFLGGQLAAVSQQH